MNTATLYRRLEALYSERDSRTARGVAVPQGITDAIKLLEGMLANSYHAHEADLQDEARAEGCGWGWIVAVGALVVAVVAIKLWTM